MHQQISNCHPPQYSSKLQNSSNQKEFARQSSQEFKPSQNARLNVIFAEQSLNQIQKPINTIENNTLIDYSNEKSYISNSIITETPCISVIKQYRDQIYKDSIAQPRLLNLDNEIGGHLVRKGTERTEFQIYQTPQRQNHDESEIVPSTASPFVMRQNGGFDCNSIPQTLQHIYQNTSKTTIASHQAMNLDFAITSTSQIMPSTQKKSVIKPHQMLSSPLKPDSESKENVTLEEMMLQTQHYKKVQDVLLKPWNESVLVAPTPVSMPSSSKNANVQLFTFQSGDKLRNLLSPSTSSLSLNLQPVVVDQSNRQQLASDFIFRESLFQEQDPGKIYENLMKIQTQIDQKQSQSPVATKNQGSTTAAVSQRSIDAVSVKSIERRKRAQRGCNKPAQPLIVPIRKSSQSKERIRPAQQCKFPSPQKSQKSPQKIAPSSQKQTSGPTKARVQEQTNKRASSKSQVAILQEESPVTTKNVSLLVTAQKSPTTAQNLQVSPITKQEFSCKPLSNLKQEPISDLQYSPCKEDRPLVKVQKSEMQQKEKVIDTAKLTLIKQKQMARRIQKAYRKHRNHKITLWKALNLAVIMIQNTFRSYMVKKGLQWRRYIKTLLMATVQAWRTRRALNCLASEVQQFVNCDHQTRKSRLREEFHLLYEKVIEDKLYLWKNAKKLQRLQQMHQNQSESSLIGSHSNVTLSNSNISTLNITRPSPKYQQLPVLEKSSSPTKTVNVPIVQSTRAGQFQNEIKGNEYMSLMQSKTSLHNNSVQNQSSLNDNTLNESLKPREASKTILLNQALKPTKPELSVDSSIISNQFRDTQALARKELPYVTADQTTLNFKTSIPMAQLPQSQNQQQIQIQTKRSVSTLSKNTPTPTPPHQSSNEQKKGEHQRSVSKDTSSNNLAVNGSSYKQKIKSVKARVDCWSNNKSSVKLMTQETTPVRYSSTVKVDEEENPQTTAFSSRKPADKFEVGTTEYIQIQSKGTKKRTQTPTDTKIRVNNSNIKSKPKRTQLNQKVNVMEPPKVILNGAQKIEKSRNSLNNTKSHQTTSIERARRSSQDSAATRVGGAGLSHQRSVSDSRLIARTPVKPTYNVVLTQMNTLLAQMTAMAQELQHKSLTKPSEHRNKQKFVNQSNKNFRQLMRQIEDQYDILKLQLQD